MDNYAFAPEWVNHTILHPVGIAVTAACCLGILLLPRAYTLLPIVLMACFIAPAQRVAVLGLDFTPARLLVLAGICRITLRGETRAFRWHPLDTFVVLWAVVGTIAYVLQHDPVQALTLRAGVLLDSVALYLLLRVLIVDAHDVRRGACLVAAVAVPVAIAFLLEASSGRNVFAAFGGVPEVTVIREGKLRCQGAFAHPIIAGCFWASLLPLLVAGLWAGRAIRGWCLAGIVSALIVIVLCASSTPVAGVAVALMAACAFAMRRMLGALRWGLLVTLVALHFVMKAPVWHLVARLNVIGGSTGWHRFYLVDECIRRFEEWALLGTKSTAHWGFGLFDVTNQYVLEAVHGGLLTLLLFIGTIVVAFRTTGQILRAAEGDPPMMALAWALGTSVLVHVVNFLGVSYFGQAVTIWYLPLAIIASLGGFVAQPAPQEPAESRWGSAVVERRLRSS